MKSPVLITLALGLAANGTDYLFIETGGFQTKNGNTWKSPWFVLKRQ